MHRQRFGAGWLGLLAGVVCAGSVVPARAQQAAGRGDAALERARAAAEIPIDLLPPQVREGVQRTVEKPTLFAHGPAETFACDPAVYQWFLEHPDRAVVAWRRLGAKCVSISDRGGGRFGWADENGSEIVWDTVYRDGQVRIWYAEGKARPAPLLPLVPVRAVVVLHHAAGRDGNGGTVLHHQADMFLRTESITASLASKLMGPSAPRMAEQCVGQLQMFFAGLAWYLHRHPERADTLLAGTVGAGQAVRPAAATRPAAD
jgi:hypothetical protein